MEDVMINVEKTKEQYGYDPTDLAPTSNKMVWWKCDKCGSERAYAYAYALRKQKKAQKEGTPELCQKCAHAHRKGKVSTRKVPTDQKAHYPLPPEVDRNLTMEKFGYDPETLSPWSRKRVVAICSVTGAECTPRRCSLNRYKSVMETGHFVSTGGYTGKRRKGVKATDETKQAMARSQKKRREREKASKEATPEPTTTPVTPTSSQPS